MASMCPFTLEEKREHVYAYIASAHGTKKAYLIEQGISMNQMRDWRAQVLAGCLDEGFRPREGPGPRVEESAALARLLAEREQLREQLVLKEAQLRQERDTVAALGKAIGLLHQADASKSSRSQVASSDLQQAQEQPDQSR